MAPLWTHSSASGMDIVAGGWRRDFDEFLINWKSMRGSKVGCHTLVVFRGWPGGATFAFLPSGEGHIKRHNL
jgi:hypothetical protein